MAFLLILFVKEKRIAGEKELEEPIDQMNGVTKKRTPLLLVPALFIALMFLVFTFQSAGSFWAYTSIYFLETLNVESLLLDLPNSQNFSSNPLCLFTRSSEISK